MSFKNESSSDRLKHHIHELSILNRIAEALNREVDLDQSLNVVLSEVAELFDLKTSWVFLLDDTTDKFYTASMQNLPPALGNNPRRLGGTCYCLNTYRDGDLEGAANINIITCSRLEHLVDGTDGLRYHASIPLYAQEKKLGVLNVASTAWEELSEHDLHLLHTVGDLLSMAIERARLFEESESIGAANERNRLAREIHDTIAQGLAASVLQLETADALLEAGIYDNRVRRAVRQALDLTRANLDEARRSVLDLRAAPLEGRTLSEAIRERIDADARQAKLHTHFEVLGEGQPLPTRVEVGLYRIAQEALNNVVQHANARNLSVQLTMLPERVELAIHDDGGGFDPDSTPPGHYGLIGLNERVRLLGGKLQIQSEPGLGTHMHIVIPLD